MTLDLIYGGFGQDGTITSQILASGGVPHIRIGQRSHECVAGSAGLCWLGTRCLETPFDMNTLTRLNADGVIRDVYFFAGHHASTEKRVADAADAIASFRVNYHLFNLVLNALRRGTSSRAVFYANSSKIFENSGEAIVSERMMSRPISAYAESKAMVRELILSLKDELPFRVYNGILFNHESAHRKPDFFTAKVINQAIQVSRGERDRVEVASLEPSVDMSLASDFCESIIKLMRSSATSGDYIFSSGRAMKLRELVRLILRKLDLSDVEVMETSPRIRSGAPCPVMGDNSKLQRAVGVTSRTPEDFVSALVDEYLLLT